MRFIVAAVSLLFLGLQVSANDPPTGLKIERRQVPPGCDDGETAQAGDFIKVHYTGRLLSGKEFDSSRNRGVPFDLTLGRSQVIKGWDEGLIGMCVGEHRTLTIPPDMGYGARGAGNAIPPNSHLEFDVEMINIIPGSGRKKTEL